MKRPVAREIYFDLALADLLRRYSAYSSPNDSCYVFPFGVDADGAVTFNVPIENVTRVRHVNELDVALREMGFLSL